MSRISGLLPDSPAKRSAVVLAASTAVMLVVTQVLFSGGTPVGILFDGFVRGLVASLATAGIVLVYKAIRVINFAQTAMGVFAGILLFLFVRVTEVPFALALVIGIVVSGVAGAIAGVVSVRFLKSSRLVLTVVTAVASQFFVQFSFQIFRLSFFRDLETLPLQEQFGQVSLQPHLPFPGWNFRIGDLGTEFGFGHVFALELCLLTLLALGVVLRYTRIGVAVRAMAENPERAGLLGISVPYLVVGIFMVSGVLGGLTTMSIGIVDTPLAGQGLAPTILLTSLSGAVLGRMVNLPTAVISTVLLGVFERAFRYAYPDDAALVSVVYLVVLGVGLLVQARGNDRVEQAQVSWAATDEPRRVPAVLNAVPLVRNLRLAVYALGLLVLGALPFVASEGTVNLASTIALGAVVVVSLVVLTGWGGQVSLGQWAFAAIGAIVASALTATAGLTFWLAVPIAAGVSAAVAALVGIPAMRIKGLFLLPVTLAFAYVAQNLFFDEKYFGWILPDEAIERPSFFFLDFEDESSMYFLCVVTLLTAIAVVGNLRRSRTGRILIALRENESNVQAFGVNVVRTKLVAFAISGALAGFAGAVYAHQQRGLTAETYGVLASIETFNAAIIGGVGSVAGALLGSMYFESVKYFLTSGLVIAFLQNGGTIVVILAYPGGFVSIIESLRDSVLRVIAQRNQLVVPSLFADYDADAAERQLIPLDELDDSSGLAALDPAQRWAFRSELYAGRGKSAAERFADASRSETERTKAPIDRNPLLEGARR